MYIDALMILVPPSHPDSPSSHLVSYRLTKPQFTKRVHYMWHLARMILVLLALPI